MMYRAGAVLFVSDLHLAPDTPAITERFLRFLAGPARQASRLIILGDLFDAWAGDDDLAAPFNHRIVTALRSLADSGVAIDFMVGNRDFLVGDVFANAAGLHLLTDPAVLELAGQRILLSHGDALCTDDADYQAWRATARTPAWRTSFLTKPLPIRQQEIAMLRERSETAKRAKAMAIMDVNPAAVATAFVEHQVTAMIHGHTHRQGRHTEALSGTERTRWVLGDWRAERGNALCCADGAWRWLDL